MPHESYSSTLATSNNNVTSAAEAKFPSGEQCIIIDEADIMWWPVYAYIHGNMVFCIKSFNSRCDSDLIGFIYESKKAVREKLGVKRISFKLYS